MAHSNNEELMPAFRYADNQWRIDKSVMIALATFLFVQTSGAIWWAASISRDVAAVTVAAEQLRQGAYTRLEASLQIVNRDQRLDNMTSRTAELETRTREIEKYLNRATRGSAQ